VVVVGYGDAMAAGVVDGGGGREWWWEETRMFVDDAKSNVGKHRRSMCAW
jgi:hypothetical protein